LSSNDSGAEVALGLRDVEVVYDRMVLALRGVSLEVPAGAVVALLGGNGAGKSTTLKAASGLLAAEGGVIRRGQVFHRGVEVGRAAPQDLVRAGLAHVLEGRHPFPQLSVEQNLIAGALVRRPRRRELAQDLDRVYAWFPGLRERRAGPAGYLSGGEQQMLVIGRALMSHPRLLLLDEPSMGLAPQVVAEIFEIVRALNQREGLTVLLAEQNATLALRYADRGYVLENGRVAIRGTARELSARPDIQHFYLGVGVGGRQRFGAPPP
jgi:branched-chain amino acid transport system ATP-binding protein